MRRWSSFRSGRPGRPGLALAAVVATVVAGSVFIRPARGTGVPSPGAVLAPQQPTPTATLPVGDCTADEPYLATTLFARGATFDAEPAVMAFRDTPDDGDHRVLATIAQVGMTYGLAYDPARRLLYAGAYHKRTTAFGPLGPGGIYAVDVTGSRIAPFAEVPDAGNDLHHRADNYQPDERGRAYPGKTSLCDLDLDLATGLLLVTNLADRRIYRLSVADGTVQGSFAHGARGERWWADARPCGLAVQGGWLFHAVVNSAFTTQNVNDLVAYVYASRADGSEMRLVATVPLRYDRGSHEKWHPWPREDDLGRFVRAYPHPLVTDIVFDDRENMILGLRDRYIDTGPSLTEGFRIAPGDILRLVKTGDLAWSFDPDLPEHFAQDNLLPWHDEITIGGLVHLLSRDVVVSTAIDPFRTLVNEGSISSGAIWFDAASGSDLGREELMYNAKRHPGPEGKANGLGDLEALCAMPATPTPTVTSPPPTATPTSTGTPRPSETATTPPTITPTATMTDTAVPRTWTIYLPSANHVRKCPPDAQRADVVLVLDRSTSMLRPVEEGGIPKNEAAIQAAKDFVGLLDFEPDYLGRHDQVAVVGFNDTAWVQLDLTRDGAAALAALDALATMTAEGTRLDLAFLTGQVPLDGPHRKPDNRAVMILLTDGLPNRVPTPVPVGPQEQTVVEAALKAREKGTRVYTVGVGKPTDINPRMLILAASDRSMYYYAPRPQDLAGIYAQIAYTIDCSPWRAPTPTPCIPEEVNADVVLVLDMSTSMYRLTRAGRTKHEAAIEAARAFLDRMDFDPDGWGRHDQVGVVGFNDTAWVALPPSRDRVAINRALDGLLARIQEGTRLDLALEAGQRALEDPGRLPENRPVMILLTDGLPNRVPTPAPIGPQEATVVEAARRAKEKGTRLYAIGLGEPDDVLRPLLVLVATTPSMYYYAPDGEDLGGIYRQIAGHLVECLPAP